MYAAVLSLYRLCLWLWIDGRTDGYGWLCVRLWVVKFTFLMFYITPLRITTVLHCTGGCGRSSCSAVPYLSSALILVGSTARIRRWSLIQSVFHQNRASVLMNEQRISYTTIEENATHHVLSACLLFHVEKLRGDECSRLPALVFVTC